MTADRDSTQATWLIPRDGEGTWTRTPPHHPATDVLVALLVCVLGGLLLLGFYLAGRTVVCHVNHDELRNCPGYVSDAPR